MKLQLDNGRWKIWLNEKEKQVVLKKYNLRLIQQNEMECLLSAAKSQWYGYILKLHYKVQTR